MDDEIEKVYKPEEIEDQPFPTESQSSLSVDQETKNDQYSAQSIKENSFPERFTAFELITASLNTRSQKILGEYQFTPQGAVQIGKLEVGESGDIRISPVGIVARNRDGETVFLLDAEAGDAIFKGTVQVGSLIAGSIITGEVDVGAGTGGAYVRLDGANNRIIIHDGTVPRIAIGNV